MSLLVERDGAVVTIVIDRPERRNAVDPATALALCEAFDEFESDESAAVAVLTGAGGHFCAGFDLKTVGEAAPHYDPQGEGPMGPTRRLLAKPVFAAVEGYAVAGGLELALWCDMRIASLSATFGVFCRRWGVPLIDGGTVRLPRIVGQGRALDMILTGRPVGAEEALAFGLADRVVGEGGARAEAERIAAEIARFPQLCLRTDRLSAYAAFDGDLDGAAGRGCGRRRADPRRRARGRRPLRRRARPGRRLRGDLTALRAAPLWTREPALRAPVAELVDALDSKSSSARSARSSRARGTIDLLAEYPLLSGPRLGHCRTRRRRGRG